jgi:hypothetical protein
VTGCLNPDVARQSHTVERNGEGGTLAFNMTPTQIERRLDLVREFVYSTGAENRLKVGCPWPCLVGRAVGDVS